MLRASFSNPLAVAALLAALVSTAAEPAFAQTSAAETARVTQLFKSGKAAFVKGDFPEAERLFAEAFAMRKSADIAANLGQSELEQHKYRSAAEHFQWALANLLPSATDAQRKAVETGFARARAEVAALRFDIRPEGSDVLVGDQNVGKTPLAGNVYVDPGEVIVSVKHDGFVSIDKRVLASKGSEQSVEIALTPREPARPTGAGAPPGTDPPIDSGLERPQSSARNLDTPPDAGATDSTDHPARARQSLTYALIGTGVAVAGGVTGLVLTLRANSKESDADNLLQQLSDQGGCSGAADESDCDRLKDARKSVDRSRNLAVGAFVVGGVAALAAGYFYWDAFSHRHRTAADGHRPSRYAFSPTIDLERPRGDRGATIQNIKLNFSGTF